MRRRRQITEGEELDNVLGVEDAEGRIGLELEQDLNERFFGEKEESQPRRIRRGDVGDDGDGGDGDAGLAGVGESEALEEDHRPRIGGDFEVFDLGGSEGGEEEEEGEE